MVKESGAISFSQLKEKYSLASAKEDRLASSLPYNSQHLWRFMLSRQCGLYMFSARSSLAFLSQSSAR